MDRLDVAQIGDPVAVVAVDIPGVPLVGEVLVQLQQVRIERPARSPPFRCRRSTAEVTRPSCETVTDTRSFVSTYPASVTSIAVGRVAADGSSPSVAPPAGTPFRSYGAPFSCTRSSPSPTSARTAASMSASAAVVMRCVLRDCLAVHPRDGRPRQDVVELMEQHLLPQLVELRRTGSCSQPVCTAAVAAQSSASTSRCSPDGCPAWSCAATSAWRGAAPGTARRPRPVARQLGPGRSKKSSG